MTNLTSREESSLWSVCERLIALDTVSTASSVEAASYLASRLDLRGWRVNLHRDTALGADKGAVIASVGPAEPGGLILSGHIDVVPHADQPGWTRDPLRLTQEGDRIYGRGVADMKAFLAQCIVLAERVDPARLRRPLAFVFTSDEEVGCLGAGRLLEHLPSLFGDVPMPDRAIIGEPTSFRVYASHKGHVRVMLRTEGIPGHSSRPDLGANAIGAMASAIDAIDGFSKRLDERTSDVHRRTFPDFPGIPFNLGMIEGGTADNMIASSCTLTVGFRPRPGDDPDALVAELRDAVRQGVRKRYPRARVEVLDVLVTPAMGSPTDGRVADVLREVSGDTSFLGAPFATDGGQFERAGIRSYIWGPGELEQAHQPDESLPVDAFFRMPALLARVVEGVCER